MSWVQPHMLDLLRPSNLHGPDINYECLCLDNLVFVDDINVLVFSFLHGSKIVNL